MKEIKEEDIINQYIKQFITLCRKTGNYDNKIGVARHNRAVKQLEKLHEEVKENEEMAKEIYNELMNSEEESVKATAASYCLAMNIKTKKAEEVLKEIIQRGKNPIERLEAKMTIKIWNEQRKTGTC